MNVYYDIDKSINTKAITDIQIEYQLINEHYVPTFDGTQVTDEFVEAFKNDKIRRRLTQTQISIQATMAGEKLIKDADTDNIFSISDMRGESDPKEYIKKISDKAKKHLPGEQYMYLMQAIENRFNGGKNAASVNDRIKRVFKREDTSILVENRDLDSCEFCSSTKGSSESIVGELKQIATYDPFRIVSLPIPDSTTGQTACYDVIELSDAINSFRKDNNNNNNNIYGKPPFVFPYTERRKFTLTELSWELCDYVIVWRNAYEILNREIKNDDLSPEDRNQITLLGRHMYMAQVEQIKRDDKQEGDSFFSKAASTTGNVASSIMGIIPGGIRDWMSKQTSSAVDLYSLYVWNNPTFVSATLLFIKCIKLLACSVMGMTYFGSTISNSITYVSQLLVDQFFVNIITGPIVHWLKEIFAPATKVLKDSFIYIFNWLKSSFSSVGWDGASLIMDTIIQGIEVIYNNGEDIENTASRIAAWFIIWSIPQTSMIVTGVLVARVYRTFMIHLVSAAKWLYNNIMEKTKNNYNMKNRIEQESLVKDKTNNQSSAKYFQDPSTYVLTTNNLILIGTSASSILCPVVFSGLQTTKSCEKFVNILNNLIGQSVVAVEVYGFLLDLAYRSAALFGYITIDPDSNRDYFYNSCLGSFVDFDSKMACAMGKTISTVSSLVAPSLGNLAIKPFKYAGKKILNSTLSSVSSGFEHYI